MSYQIKYSDGRIITIQDKTIDSSTISLDLVGRNSPTYGEAISRNFLHLLENFSYSSPPGNPTSGQIWYDTSDPANSTLRVFDGSAWRPSNGVHHQDVDPIDISNPRKVILGDIWVDTGSNQLKIYDGANWTIVGPTFSSTNRTGSYATQLNDRNGDPHDVIIMYLNDIAVEIIAKESFTPISTIEGFSNLVPGINLSTKLFDSVAPRFFGPSSSAFALKQTTPSTEIVSANNFVRNDINQKINGSMIINNDNGMAIGQSTATFLLQRIRSDANIVSTWDGGRIVFKTTKNQIINPMLIIDGFTNGVGVNTSPASGYALDVLGNSRISGRLDLTYDSSILSIVAQGDIKSRGIQSTGTVIFASTANFQGTATIGTVSSSTRIGIAAAYDNTYDIGSENYRFRTIYAATIGSSTKPARLNGSVTGSASSLETTQNFSIAGDATSTAKGFNGTGPVSLSITLQPGSIHNKGSYPGPGTAATTGPPEGSDELLIYKSYDNGLYKVSKTNFLGDVTPGLAPTGAMMLWSDGAVVPNGWLKCQGTGLSRATFSALYAVIGTQFGNTSDTNFLIPNIPKIYATTATNAIVNPPPMVYIIKT